MTYEEKKAWLWRYRTAKRFELLKLDELATLQTDATHTTQRFSPVPCATPSGLRSWRCSASWTMRWIS